MARRSDHSREELHRMALAATRSIVAKEGLRGLSTRRIARKMGYAPGTLYQLFDDLDDLIVHLNATTLDALFESCQGANLAAGPEVALQELADRYIRFVTKVPRLWSALFEHNLPRGKEMPEWYDERVMKLLGLAELALEPLFRPSAIEQRQHEALVLWASLYGIASLASARKLGPAAEPMDMVKSLVGNYLAGLRIRNSLSGSHQGLEVRQDPR